MAQESTPGYEAVANTLTPPLSCSPFQVAGTRTRSSRGERFRMAATEQGRRHDHQNDG
jgi:hypothetical protein